MEKLPTLRPPTASHGSVLLLALVFMLMLAIIASTVIQTAILQVRMAGNDQFLEEALHKAQAIATELSLNPNNFVLEGGVGYTNCPVSEQSLHCDRRQLQIPGSAVAPPGVEVDYRVIRQDPLLWRDFPLREAQDAASSSSGFDAAIFEIDVRVYGSEKRFGNAHIVQGVAVRVPAFR
jgi:PilX N-terminal